MGNDRLRATDREEEIDAVAADLYDAVGVGPADRVVFDYERSTNQSCAVTLGVEEGFGEGEAWYGRKAYDLRRGGPDDYDEMFAAAAEHLRGNGWQVQEYVFNERQRTLTALRDDVAVLVDIAPFSMLVTAGPCASELNGVEDRFKPVPPGTA